MKTYNEMLNDVMTNYKRDLNAKTEYARKIFEPMKDVNGVLRFNGQFQYWIGVIGGIHTPITTLDTYARGTSKNRITKHGFLCNDPYIHQEIYAQANKKFGLTNITIEEIDLDDNAYKDILKDLFSSEEGFNHKVTKLYYGYGTDKDGKLNFAWVVCEFEETKDIKDVIKDTLEANQQKGE